MKLLLIIKINISGSVAGGGRYDNLIGMFGKEQIPSVGFSIGLERIFKIYEQILSINKDGLIKNNTDIIVISNAENSIIKSIELCKILWENGYSAKFNQIQELSLKKQYFLASIL